MNGVAGVLEKGGRDDEALAAMAEAYEIASKVPGVEEEVLMGAKKNLDGLRRHVAKKKRKAEAQAKAEAREL